MAIQREKTEGGVKSIYGFVPPQDIEAECAVIGACLLESDTFGQIAGILPTHECFYKESNALVFEALWDMHREGRKIDLITVTDQLRKKGTLEKAGGAYELTNLTMSVVSTAHVQTHAALVLEKYHYRELIRVCMTAINDAYTEQEDIYDLIERTKHETEKITADIESGGDITAGMAYLEAIKELEYQKKHRAALTGVDTGLHALNEITNGWQKTDLIILGGRPSKGKTALALNLGLSAAISELVNGVPVGIFSLEMGYGQLIKRMASTVTGISFGKIISGNLTDEELNAIREKSSYFHKLKIKISDKIFSMPKIIAKARKWKEKDDIGLLVIDYLQLIKATRQKGDNREQEISSISRDLKLLAKELEIPIILLSQLNRNVESRGSDEPMPADLRESGAIEQDADVIIFPWHGDDESFISVAKNRNGQTAVKENALKIKFSGTIQKWMEPSAFDAFKDVYVPDNARAGILNNYQRINNDPQDDGPF